MRRDNCKRSTRAGSAHLGPQQIKSQRLRPVFAWATACLTAECRSAPENFSVSPARSARRVAALGRPKSGTVI